VKLLPFILSVLLILFRYYPTSAADEVAVNSALTVQTVMAESVANPEKRFCEHYNDLNNRIRDGLVTRAAAASEIKRLLGEIRPQYYRQGGEEYPRSVWIFPLAGYGIRAIDVGLNHGYIAKGYDFFSGNRHGGHPSLDIFIIDRNQDQLDDRSDRPVTVLSMTGGIVVAVENTWEKGSWLRGGKYIWIYDTTNDLLVYYAHNNELFVKLGDMVKPGDRLATVGRSGYNAGKRRSPTHLHLTVLQVKGGRPQPVDVFAWLRKARVLPSLN